MMAEAQRFSRLVIATHNQGKLREFHEMLGIYLRDIVSSAELNLPEPEETGSTFSENALLKARAAAEASGLPALADDSGLCVGGLGGKPGIYAARWAGPERDFGKAVGRIRAELGDNPDRSAFFICVLALAWPDGHAETFEDRCEGELVWVPRGANGIGYDPWFVPAGRDKTFGEMNSADKQALSHRGKAVRRLIARIFQ